MKSFAGINAHHIGSDHMQKGLQCEDCSGKYSDDKMAIMVVSDGHGDKNCFRSKEGAAIACEVAIELCRQFQAFVDSNVVSNDCQFNNLLKN